MAAILRLGTAVCRFKCRAIYSEPIDLAILLGSVDLDIDRKQFRNKIKFQDSLSAVSHVGFIDIGTGRHGGRPSRMLQN